MTKTATTSLAEFKAKALSKTATKAAYDALGPEFEAAVLVIQARARAGLSQAELAQAMGTSQSAIARLEAGRIEPSLSTLRRIAKATGTKLRVNLVVDR